MTYLVTFGAETKAVHDAVVAAIKEFGDWAELTAQSYLIETGEGVRPIIERLQRLLGASDTLWVLTVSAPWAGHGDPIVEDHAIGWLGEFEDWIPADWDDQLGVRRWTSAMGRKRTDRLG